MKHSPMKRPLVRRALPLALLMLIPLSSSLLARSGNPPQRHRLDTNQDGAIDRAEAAAMPRLAERFDELDRNKDGRLSADERPQRHGGRKGGRHGGGGMQRLDTDKDGRISRGEFDAGKAAREQNMAARGPKAPGPLADFDAIDTNRDGYLVGSELRAHYERMAPQREAMRAARMKQKFDELDVNRDGKLGRVEVDDKMPRLAERFAWLDENRDGFISRAEFENARGGRH